MDERFFLAAPCEWIHDHSEWLLVYWQRVHRLRWVHGHHLGPTASPVELERWDGVATTIGFVFTTGWRRARRVGSGTSRRHRNRDYDLVGLERGRRPSLSEMAGTGRRFGGRPVHGGWPLVFA